MARSIFQHPGYLGLTSQGVILIHADWPAYATEHGIGYALMSLGQFPSGTKFTLLDDIDQCFLFLVGDHPSRGDAFADSNFHVALWHEDVQALSSASYVSGAKALPYGEWARRRAAALQGLMWQRPDGSWAPVPVPEPDDSDDWPERQVVVVDSALSMTDAGFAALEHFLVSERRNIDENIMRRARPAILAGLFDSAIREACVVVEFEMREAVGTAAFGAKLIDDFFDRAAQSGKLISSQLKTFRTEVRAAFRFIRNEYAHNLHAITQSQCYAILARVSNVYLGV